MTNLSSSLNHQVNLSCHLDGHRGTSPGPANQVVRQPFPWSATVRLRDQAASQPRARAALRRSSALPDFPTFSNQLGK